MIWLKVPPPCSRASCDPPSPSRPADRSGRRSDRRAAAGAARCRRQARCRRPGIGGRLRLRRAVAGGGVFRRAVGIGGRAAAGIAMPGMSAIPARLAAGAAVAGMQWPAAACSGGQFGSAGAAAAGIAMPRHVRHSAAAAVRGGRGGLAVARRGMFRRAVRIGRRGGCGHRHAAASTPCCIGWSGAVGGGAGLARPGAAAAPWHRPASRRGFGAQPARAMPGMFMPRHVHSGHALGDGGAGDRAASRIARAFMPPLPRRAHADDPHHPGVHVVEHVAVERPVADRIGGEVEGRPCRRAGRLTVCLRGA